VKVPIFAMFFTPCFERPRPSRPRWLVTGSDTDRTHPEG
jgi:hypothetical protein